MAGDKTLRTEIYTNLTYELRITIKGSDLSLTGTGSDLLCTSYDVNMEVIDMGDNLASRPVVPSLLGLYPTFGK